MLGRRASMKVSGETMQPMAVPITCPTNMDLGDVSVRWPVLKSCISSAETCTSCFTIPQPTRPAMTPLSFPPQAAKMKRAILPPVVVGVG